MLNSWIDTWPSWVEWVIAGTINFGILALYFTIFVRIGAITIKMSKMRTP